jgi:hypothetical protein
MIKLILKGGLGNQMFQYAAAKSLALDLNTDLYLDLSFLKNRLLIKGFTAREFDLDLFDVPEKSGTPTNIDILDKYLTYPAYFLYNRTINPSKYIEGANYYYHDEDFHKLKPNVTIEGYFNNSRYFEPHQKEIRSLFDPDKLYDPAFEYIEKKISSTNSVSINIRRGDYLNNKHSGVFTYLGKEYYSECLSVIREKTDNPHFFVFSFDDPEWFKNTFKLNPTEYTMIGNDYTGYKFRTYLRLISLCKHNIISNSTFAWWGAYLNKNQDKIVISAKRWVYKYEFDIPEKWIAIDNT